MEKHRLAGSQKKFSGVFKLLPNCPSEHFEEKSFSESFSIFCGFFWIISGHWAETVWRACQSCIPHIYRNILSKKEVSKTIESFHQFETVSEKFSAFCRLPWRVCQKCFLRVHNNVSEKKQTLKTYLFRHCWSVNEKLSIFYRENSTELSKKKNVGPKKNV